MFARQAAAQTEASDAAFDEAERHLHEADQTAASDAASESEEQIVRLSGVAPESVPPTAPSRGTPQEARLPTQPSNSKLQPLSRLSSGGRWGESRAA